MMTEISDKRPSCPHGGRLFCEELRRFGPESSSPVVTPAEAYAYCDRLARSHYENFSVASLLLPKELRQPFQVVYAYCRWSDDLADENDGSDDSRRRSLELLDWWKSELDDCFSNRLSKHPVLIALKEVAQRFHLSKQPFTDLLIAFRRDQVRQRYESLEDLLDYCRYSAEPVGRIVLGLVYGAESSAPTFEQLSWSDSICTGLQLANFWQDVSRDAEMGRRYIPRSIATRYRVDIENLQDSPAFRDMLKELVQDARSRLLAGKPLIRSVPGRIQIDIELFLLGGLAILDAIEKSGYNVLLKRPVVSKWTKFRLLCSALSHRVRGKLP